uniref:Sucrose nonfermenting 4-like protein isoform X3 n=1 Tax=Rhizophora mucronata TaxID=61149 RepID=A0A2P2QV19_RHIMU
MVWVSSSSSVKLEPQFPSSLKINMKSDALSTPTNWPLLKSQSGAIGIPCSNKI